MFVKKIFYYFLFFLIFGNDLFYSRLSSVDNPWFKFSMLLQEYLGAQKVGTIFGYDLLFMNPDFCTRNGINFFQASLVIMLQAYLAKKANIKPLFSELIDWGQFYLGSFFKKKFIFNRNRICKTYPANYSFNIVGYEGIINPIDNIINIFKDPSEDDFIHPGHVLLYGPPGTGKTKMISDLLIKNKLDFVFVDMNLLRNAPVENLPIIFENFSNKKTAFLIDEFDGFLPPSKLKRALSPEEEKQLSFWKTIFDSNDPKAKNRLIFCTTNHKDYLDDGILRPGRLENHFEVGNPNSDDRLKIFFSKCWEYRVPTIEGLSDEEIKHRFENCSGARIDKAVRLLAITQKKLKNESLSKKHFDEKLF